jgi:hypothetical protein
MRESMIIYRSFYDAIKELEPLHQAKVWEAVFEYGLNQNQIDLSGLPSTIFKLIKPQLDANLRKYANGNKGGRPKKAKENLTETKTEPKNKLNESKVKANVNKNENENNNDNVKEYKESLNLWLQYKKEKKQTYKPTGLEALKKTIIKDYPNPLDFTKAVEYSIANNYSGIYPPKKITLQTPTITHKRATLDD